MGHKGRNEGSPTYQDTYTTRYDNPGQSPKTRRDPWQHQRILTLDGGGARGLWSLYVLKKLMDAIVAEESSSNPPALSSTSSPLYLPVEDRNLRSILATDPDSLQLGQRFRPCHYFDYICGRDLGGVHALLLGVLRLSVEDAICRVEAVHNALDARLASRQVTSFSWSGITYWKSKNSIALASALHVNLVERRTDSDLSTEKTTRTLNSNRRRMSKPLDDDFCRTFILATHKARKGVHVPYVLRSYDAREAKADVRNAGDDTSSFPLVDVARTALSSRDSYNSVKIHGIPGRFRNAEARVNPAVEAYNEVCGLHDSQLQCLLSIGSGDGTAVGFDYLERQAQAQDLDEQFPYMHLYPSHKIEGDPVGIRYMAEKFCVAHDNDIHQWARELVMYRRNRSSTDGWKRFAGMHTVSTRDVDEKSAQL